MKRSGFKSKLPPPRPVKQIEDYTPRPRAVAVASAGPARAVVSIPKDAPERSESYRRLVASLPCINCNLEGYSQAAHPNYGKGAGMKTDDRLCFPLCADRPGVRGCHSLHDQGGLRPKLERREWELAATAATQRALNG